MKSLRISVSLLCLILGLAFNPVHAQKNKKKKGSDTGSSTNAQPATVNEPKGNDDAYTFQEKLFRQGLKYDDLTLATNALHSMMLLKPGDKTLKDTLAMVYFRRTAFPQVILLGEEILKENPSNNPILELVAVSKQNLGLAKEALSDYERLYTTSKNIYHLYEIAGLQFALKRFGECETSLARLVNDSEIEEKEININLSQGRQQKVPLKAAAFNMQGVIAMELKNYEAARTAFNAALKLKSDFALPLGNLDYMKKMEAGGNK